MADGRVYVAGNFDSVNGVKRPGLARLLNDGALDLSFAPTNLPNDFAVLVIQADGKIVGTKGGSVNGVTRPLLRLNLDGSKDENFSPTWQSWLPSTLFQSGVEQIGGKLLLYNWTLIPDGNDGTLIRLNPDGSLD